MAGETEAMRGKIDGAKICLVIFGEKMRKLPGSTWETIWKVGQDDPRRVIHALKVGLSLTLVSLLYLMEPLFKGIGESAIWAVMTVVVVLEFTAGKFNYHYSISVLLVRSVFLFLFSQDCIYIYRAIPLTH